MQHLLGAEAGTRAAPARPEVSLPGDRHEQEAERVTARVMRTPAAEASPLQSEGRDSAGGVAGRHGGLDPQTQRFFESRFGYSFDDVRIHTGGPAHETARALGARAYTVGNQISFAQGEYRPRTRDGRRLLAHELTHVVQQTRTPERAKPRAIAGSLTSASHRPIQRKLVATGDAAGFAALANAVIAVQFEVVIGPGGRVTLRSTDVQGPPTPEAQVLVETMRRVIGHSGTTSIEFIHGATTTRASDRRVLGGSFPQGKVDLDDEAALGTQESIGLGQGATAGAVLAHEIEEQFRKQQLGQEFDEAHEGALAVEAAAVGAERVSSRRSIAGGFEYTYTYTYPDGRVVELKFDLVNGNRTNVRRTVRRPTP
jgi:hypothetical protein